MSRRKYRVFEDSSEPAYLQLLHDCLSITYEHKSIIYSHSWESILEFKPTKLQKLNAPINRKDVKHNLLEVYIASIVDSQNSTSTPKPSRKKVNNRPVIIMKLFRFESRNNIDEFLTEAIRIGCIERIVQNKLFSKKIRYLPCATRKNNNDSEGSVKPSSDDE